jgi:GNAT superfamily N-acetyltransferase
MSVILVRNFSPADQSAAADLINSGLGKRFGIRDDTKNPDLYDIAAYYAEDCFVVANIGDEVVGTGAMIYEGKLVTRVVRMHTAEARRRQGIGTAVLDELESRARAYGAHEIILDTDIDWHDAHAFYKASGYVEFRRNELGIRFHKLIV